MNDLEIIQAIQQLNQLNDIELITYIKVTESEKLKVIAVNLLAHRQEEQKVKRRKPRTDYRQRLRKAAENQQD